VPTPPPKRILVVLFLGVLMAALDIAIVGPALPALREHFGVTERTVAWVFNVFVLLNLLGVPLMAKLSDVFGRRTVYTVDVLLFGVGSVVVASAPSFEVLLVGRGVQGLATSGIFPVASAVVGDVFPPERRGRALGILGAVFGLAFIIGPILAGILLSVLSWPWLFLINLPLGAGIAVAAWRTLPTSRPDARRQVDWGGIALLGTLLVSLAYGINQVDTEALGASLTSLRVWGALGLAAVLLPAFIWWEARAPEPLVRLGLFRSRQVVLAGLLAAGAGLTEAAFIFFPGLAVAAFGVTKSTASFMLLPLVGAVAVGAPVAGRLIDRVGARTVVLGGTTVLTVGLATVGLVPDERVFFYGGSVAIGLGLSCLLGSAIGYILLNAARVTERTVAQGVSTLFISIGQLTGSALIGAVATSEAGAVAGYGQAFLVIAGVAALLAVASLGLKSRAAELLDATRRQASSDGG
jgi:EmrB/QacA subfamily drug resistance transporter